MSITERKKKMLNRMCNNCLNLNNSCKGTENFTWTGCVFRQAAKSELYDGSYLPVISTEELKEKGVLIEALKNV